MKTALRFRRITCLLLAAMLPVSFGLPSPYLRPVAAQEPMPQAPPREEQPQPEQPQTEETRQQEDDTGSGKRDRTGEILTYVGVVVIGAAILNNLLRRRSPARVLSDDGPRFPDEFSMSAFEVKGFVRGGWPIVVEYEVERTGGLVYLVVAADKVKPAQYQLDTSRPGPRMAILETPGRFAEETRPGTYVITAFQPPPGDRERETIIVHAIGAGPTAVGSLNIDRLEFGPGTLKVKQNDIALYKFRSLRRFERARVEVDRITREKGEYRIRRTREMKLSDGLQENEVVQGPDKRWDGKDGKKKPSIGRHRLRVRAWTDPKTDGSWLSPASKTAVTVVPE